MAHNHTHKMANLNEIQQKLELVIGVLSEAILAVKQFQKRKNKKNKK